MADRLSIVLPPERPFQTTAGYALERFSYLPAIGESFDDQGWRFEVGDLHGRRIDKILARRIVDERRSRQNPNWAAPRAGCCRSSSYLRR